MEEKGVAFRRRNRRGENVDSSVAIIFILFKGLDFPYLTVFCLEP